MSFTRAFWIDWGERVGATFLAAGIGVTIPMVAELPMWLSLPITTGLTMAKGYLSGFVGRRGTASALPAQHDPASQ